MRAAEMELSAMDTTTTTTTTTTTPTIAVAAVTTIKGPDQQPGQLVAQDNSMQSHAQLQNLNSIAKLGSNPISLTTGHLANGSPPTLPANHQNNNHSDFKMPIPPSSPEDNQQTRKKPKNNNSLKIPSIIKQLVADILEEVERETKRDPDYRGPPNQHFVPGSLEFPLLETEQKKATILPQHEQEPSEKVARPDSNHAAASTIVAAQGLGLAQLNVAANDEPIDLEGSKEMVILRNLEISPPPIVKPATPNEEQDPKNKQPKSEPESSTKTPANKRSQSKRRRPDPVADTDLDSSVEGSVTNTRSKRQRTQTKLFQAGDAKPSACEPFASSSTESPSPIKKPKSAFKVGKKSSNNSKDSDTQNAQTKTVQDQIYDKRYLISHDLRDVIFYEKNDYLAIRNEENSFYLCQLTENVRVVRPMIKVKWLDTEDDGKTYFLTSHYDMVPHKSIIMPVVLNKMKSDKKTKQFFTLDDQDRENILDRLKRSLNAVLADPNSSSQESNAVE